MPQIQQTIKAPQFSFGSDDDARRQLRMYNMDTSILFSYKDDKPFVCKAETKEESKKKCKIGTINGIVSNFKY